MALRLALIKAPDNLAAGELGASVHTFDELGGTLGRSSSNSWVLPDPDRFLSSCHCEIICEQGQFFLVDLSTNGTFLNGSPEPLGKGMRSPLTDGDTFEMGDYRFSVSLDSGAIPDSPSSAQALRRDPFAAGVDADQPNPGGLKSALFEASAFDSAPFPDGTIESIFNASPLPENRDPLALLDRAQGHQDSPVDDDPFATFESGRSINHTPALDEALSWPETKTQNLIPDDWEDDLFGTSGPTFQAGEYSRAELQAEPGPTAMESSPMSPFQTSQVALPVNDHMPGRAFRQRRSGPSPDPEPRAGGLKRPTPRPSSGRLAASADAGGVADRDSDGFIRALGMNPDSMSLEQRQTINQMGGKILRELMEGVMQLLRSRSTIKNEFRMNVTTIEPFENNPFKFSVGVDDALENIFLKRGKAYKEPLEALDECFHELGEHQLAMIAGIREGFQKMMTRFDPLALEKVFERRGKHSSLPGLRQARCWTNYRDYYAGFSDNMDASFQSLFGTDFVQAYEDHLRTLGASRKKQRQMKVEIEK